MLKGSQAAAKPAQLPDRTDAPQRYSIVLSPDQRRIVVDLEELGGFSNQKEVFQTGLALLAWCLREVKRGRIIASLEENTGSYAELQVPAFERARRSSVADEVSRQEKYSRKVYHSRIRARGLRPAKLVNQG